MKQKRIRDLSTQLNTNANRGFSLVEVLVCVALLAIISVPILSSLQTSAKLNQKAHYTQKMTNYAQEELEVVKVMSLKADSGDSSEYARYLDAKYPLNGGEKYAVLSYDDSALSVYEGKGTQYDLAKTAMNTAAGQDALSSLADAEKKELTEPFFYQIKNMQIGSDQYTMLVTVEPAVYSMENLGDDTYGTNANVAGIMDFKNVDASIYPVLSNEINMFDAGEMGTALLANIKNKLNALGAISDDDMPSVNEQDILKKITKTATVTISESGTGDDAVVHVGATVDYVCTYNGSEVKLDYIVYDGNYSYAPAVSGNPDRMNGSKTGGAVFLFADAWQGTSPGDEINHNEDGHCKNIVNISIEKADDMPIDVYFVRGTPKNAEIGYNLDELNVSCDGGNVYQNKINSGIVQSGEKSLGNGAYFHTNVKVGDFKLYEVEDHRAVESTIGGGSYDTRCYQITVELFEQDEDGNVIADDRKAVMTSTKIVKR